MTEHFARVAPHYDALRRTDSAPVAAIADRLGRAPLMGADVATGTGRYGEALYRHLPSGSLVFALDHSAEMLLALRGAPARGPRMPAVQCVAEALPLRPSVLDFLTCFNAIHHLDAETFLDEAASALGPGGWLFIYTRTPEQNARTIWGRHFPGFAERETRLLPVAWYQEMIGRHPALRLCDLRVFSHHRTSTPEDLSTQVAFSHYSTFSLYEPAVLKASLEEFLQRVDSPVVRWADENLLVSVQRI
jgi:SAM-dependent methyltransferase